MKRLPKVRQGLARLRLFRSTVRLGVMGSTVLSILLWALAVAFVLDYGIGFVYRPLRGGPADSLVSLDGREADQSALGNDYLVDHTARTFLIDRDGRLVAQILPTTQSDALRDALRRALGAR